MKLYQGYNPRIKILIIIGIILVLVALAFALWNFVFKPREAEREKEYADEIARIEDFVKDWYAEISEKYGKPDTYKNELQAGGRTYTLTYEQGRIRAVYPRGVRNFQTYYVTGMEFFESGNRTRCRINYGKGGMIEFPLS